MKRLFFAVLFGAMGYVIATFVSYYLISLVSSNMHDRSVEAAMASAFFFGPLGALAGIVSGVVVGGRLRPAPRL